MKISAIKDTLELYDIPTHSWNRAIEQVSDEQFVSEEDYIRRTAELTGVVPRFEDGRKYRYLYLYTVQEGARAIVDGMEEIDLNTIAHDCMNAFFERCNWVLAVYERQSETVSKDGKPKAKRGAKKEQAKALYAKHKDDNLSRKEWIEMLVKEVDMTKAGASTYYSNLKKGVL